MSFETSGTNCPKTWHHLPAKFSDSPLRTTNPRKEYTLLLLEKMFELVRKVTWAHFVRFEVLVAMNILAYYATQYGR